jgi:hypothetical protein
MAAEKALAAFGALEKAAYGAIRDLFRRDAGFDDLYSEG